VIQSSNLFSYSVFFFTHSSHTEALLTKTMAVDALDAVARTAVTFAVFVVSADLEGGVLGLAGRARLATARCTVLAALVNFGKAVATHFDLV